MYRRKIIFCISLLFSFILISCGTSTGSRYAQEQVQQKKTDTDSTGYPENFDLTKYHSKIDIKDKAKPADSSPQMYGTLYHASPQYIRY